MNDERIEMKISKIIREQLICNHFNILFYIFMIFFKLKKKHFNKVNAMGIKYVRAFNRW